MGVLLMIGESMYTHMEINIIVYTNDMIFNNTLRVLLKIKHKNERKAFKER